MHKLVLFILIMYKFVYLYKQTFFYYLFNLNSNSILLYNKFEYLIYSNTIYLLPLD